jgi:protein ImuA
MSAKKEDIIRQLQQDILQMQGFKRVTARDTIRINLGPIDTAFPNGSFPLPAVHEFINKDIACTAATNGFISFLISSLMEKGDACVWISSSGTVFPPALKSFGVEPDKIIFINVHKEKEILWVMEEALKCEGLAAVVGEIKEIGFTESRRLQLAVEKSHVTGFIIRNDPRNMHVNACVSRWRISPIPSGSENNLPGVGFPRWNIELLKIRNGRPGSWQMEWSYNLLHSISNPVELLVQEEKRKAG